MLCKRISFDNNGCIGPSIICLVGISFVLSLINKCLMVQAYHNELVSKVTRLEQENIKLKKEKVHDLIHVFPLNVCCLLSL